MAGRSVNKVILIGRLGKDAETKFTPSGMAKTSFTVATNYNRKDPQTGEWKEETDWHNIGVWKAENLANYLLKGKQVYIEGRLTSRSYDDKDGNKRYFTEVVANASDVILLGGGDREVGGAGGEDLSQPVSMPRSAPRPQQQQRAPESGPMDITDDDVPF
jgi:single-strand DNA-binding protein